WELATGKMVRIYAGAKGPIRCLAVSPNGRHFLFGDEAGLVCFADLQTGAVPVRMAGHTGPIWALTIASDWRHAMSLSGDRTLRVWDIHELKPRGRVAVPGGASVLAVSENSRLALTGGEDAAPQLWLVPLAPGESGGEVAKEIILPER